MRAVRGVRIIGVALYLEKSQNNDAMNLIIEVNVSIRLGWK